MTPREIPLERPNKEHSTYRSGSIWWGKSCWFSKMIFFRMLTHNIFALVDLSIRLQKMCWASQVSRAKTTLTHFSVNFFLFLEHSRLWDPHPVENLRREHPDVKWNAYIFSHLTLDGEIVKVHAFAGNWEIPLFRQICPKKLTEDKRLFQGLLVDGWGIEKRLFLGHLEDFSIMLRGEYCWRNKLLDGHFLFVDLLSSPFLSLLSHTWNSIIKMSFSVYISGSGRPNNIGTRSHFRRKFHWSSIEWR